MARPAELVVRTPVTLLGRDDACRAQLRQALLDLGAEIVHEGDLSTVDCAAIIAQRPSVVLVNLEAGAEDALDGLDALFADPAVNVVFNEAETTSQLTGWDLARWARHLAAKVLGRKETVPPPPPGAEALPQRDLQPRPGSPRTPAEEVGDVSIDGFAAEAANSEHAVPASLDLALGATALPAAAANVAPHGAVASAAPPRGHAVTGPGAHEPDTQASADDQTPVAVHVERELHGGPAASDDFSLDLGEIEQALAGLGDASPAADGRATTTSAGERDPIDDALSLELTFDDDGSDAQTAGGFDFDPVAAEGSMSPSAQASPDRAFDTLQPDGDDVAALDLDGSSGSAALDASAAADRNGREAASTQSAFDPVSAEFDGDGDMLEFDGSLDFALGDTLPTSVDEASAELDLSLDADVAALAAQLDADLEQPTAAAEQGLSLDFDFTPDDDDGDAAETDHAARPAPASAALPDLDLALDLALPTVADSGDGDPPSDSQEASGALGELSLAPSDQPVAERAAASGGGYDFSSLTLSLEPIESAADEPAAPTIDAPPAVDGAAVVDEAAGASAHAIPRVIVLGASIGGPDALRTFLGALPAGFPALLLLAQHLDNGFFSRLATQLQKVCKLPIRVADDGAGPARAGEVIIVPSNRRYVFEDDGSIDPREHDAPPRYKPCIDDLMRDVAERFDRRVTAIIFSGMAGDAIEGAVQVTARGGEVWAQSPESCVVSSMVDGARSRGVVEFVGSPRELADRCVERFAARTPSPAL